jgi:hypothetical protein
MFVWESKEKKKKHMFSRLQHRGCVLALLCALFWFIESSTSGVIIGAMAALCAPQVYGWVDPRGRGPQQRGAISALCSL